MIQVKTTPIMAWFSPKRKLLMGLHTTTYRSMARTTKDHRAISPARQSAINQHAPCLDPTVQGGGTPPGWERAASKPAQGRVGARTEEREGFEREKRSEGAVRHGGRYADTE